MGCSIYWPVMLAFLVAGLHHESAACPDWLELAEGVSGDDPNIEALCIYDPDDDGPMSSLLVAGGEFSSAGGIPASNIAVWDGAAWSSLSGGVSGAVAALTTFDPDGFGPMPTNLIVGYFGSTAGGVSATWIARWDGTAWHPVGGSPNNPIHSLGTFDPDGQGPGSRVLVAGGKFTAIGGVSANRVARWNGTTWQAFGAGLGTTFFDAVGALIEFDPDQSGPQVPWLIAGGDFTQSGTTPVNYIARWNGSSWQPMATGFNDTVASLCVYDPDSRGPQEPQLIAGGSFLSLGGRFTFTNRIARWTGSSWVTVGSGVGSTPRSMTTYVDEGNPDATPLLLVASVSSSAGGVSGKKITSWNGSSWSVIGVGFNDWANSVAVYDADQDGPLPGKIVAGGYFTATADTSTVLGSVSRWDCPSPAEPGDMDADGTINGIDLALLLGLWGPCSLPPPVVCTGDLDGDGYVNGFDLAILLAGWD